VVPERVRVLQAITRMMVGGAQLTALQTCRLIDRDRFRCELLTGPQTGPEGDLLSVAVNEGTPTTVVEPLVREIRPWKDWSAYRKIRGALLRPPGGGGPYTIVHTHTSKAGILVRRAARACGVPFVVHTVHGWQWTDTRSRAFNRLIRESERRAARWTDRLIAVAETDRVRGLEAGVGRPEQYRVIESAIDLDEFHPARVDRKAVRGELGIPPGSPVAGTVGRFADQKAPGVMLEAARILLERMPEAHFLYVGDGPLRDAVLSPLGEFARHPRLHLLGLRTDVARLLGAMDVFLLSSWYEGMPRVVAEAMSMDLPVVSTPAGGVPEVVVEGETGHLVPFGDPAGLAAAAGILLGDPARARSMGAEAGRRVRKRFDVHLMVERIQELYEDLMAGKGIGGRSRPFRSTVVPG